MPTTASRALLSVFGGKITTYRRLAEHALEKLSPFLGTTRRPTRAGPGASRCPAASSRWSGVAAQVDQLINRYGFLARPHAARLVRMYGTRAKDVLGAAQSAADLGRDFGATLTQARDRLSDARGMGGARRRHPVAALQAGPHG